MQEGNRAVVGPGSGHEGVVVTGASTGIGAAITRELRGGGFEVFATVRRAKDGAALEALGVTPVLMDVTDVESISRARNTVMSALGERPLRGLVNNAGIARGGPLELLPLEEFRRVLEVNLLGVISVSQAFLPILRAARGRIINISSVSGRVAMPFSGPYTASKFALEGISDTLRRELMCVGVQVIVIQAGTVRTPIWDKLAATDADVFRGTVYTEAVDRVRELALRGSERGLPPTSVARAVAGALTARRPRPRILVVRGFGLGSRLLRLLPCRWADLAHWSVYPLLTAARPWLQAGAGRPELPLL